jgi:hypothetical protein
MELVETIDAYARPWILWVWEKHVLPHVMGIVAIGARKGVGFVAALLLGMGAVTLLTRGFFWAVGVVKEAWNALLAVGAWVLGIVKFYWTSVLKIAWWLLYIAAGAWLGYTYAYEHLADPETQDKIVSFIGVWLPGNKTASH